MKSRHYLPIFILLGLINITAAAQHVYPVIDTSALQELAGLVSSSTITNRLYLNMKCLLPAILNLSIAVRNTLFHNHQNQIQISPYLTLLNQ